MPRFTKHRMRGKLTERQERFCQEYLVDLNGAQAAVRAGYSERSAAEQAYDLLRRPHLVDRIAVLAKERSERTRIKADEVLLELYRLAMSDMRNYASWSNENVTLTDSDDLTEDESRAVRSVKKRTKRYETRAGNMVVETEVEFSLHNKEGPLEKLGRHLALFTDKFEVDASIPFFVFAPESEMEAEEEVEE